MNVLKSSWSLRSRVVGTVLASLLVMGGCASSDPSQRAAGSRDPAVRVKVVETGPLTIAGIMPSMMGPSERVHLDIADLDWVTAFRAEVIDDTTDEKMGDEFFCHSQLQMYNGTRLFVTATGAEEVRFPEGFAMPVSRILSGVPPEERPLSFFGMALNNHDRTLNRQARVRGTFEYIRDEDIGDPPRLKKLFKTELPMMVQDAEAYMPPLDAADEDVTTHCVLVGSDPVHWYVPPGPQTTRLRYKGDFLPVDSTVHYALVHLHNHGIYFKLTDVTAGRVLWQTEVIYEPDRVQIARIPEYSSPVGFRMYRNHEYEIEAFYNNTSEHAVDAMAAIELFYNPDGNVDISFPGGPGSDR